MRTGAGGGGGGRSARADRGARRQPDSLTRTPLALVGTIVLTLVGASSLPIVITSVPTLVGANHVGAEYRRVTAHIRLACDADADAIAAIYRPIVETTAISFEMAPPDRDEIARRIADTMRMHPWLACDLDGRLAGYAYASGYRLRVAYRWSVDTSVYVHEAFRGRGVARGLYKSLMAILRTQGFFNAYAGIALPNPASVGLHEALGFEKVGLYRRAGYKLGEWRDVGWWQLILAPHLPSPPEPLALGAVSAQPDWERLVTSGQSSVRVNTHDRS